MKEATRDLLEKFETRDGCIVVVGQGYVGLPIALEFVQAGFEVYGLDVSEAKVDALRQGRSYITDIDGARVADAVETGRFHPTSDYSVISKADAVSICVPTPLNKTREPDLTYIRAAAQELTPHLTGPALVVLESTTYPGTTEEVLLPILAEAGLELGEELFVAFSPERVDPGNPVFGVSNTPKVVGGVTAEATRLAEVLYGSFVENIHTVHSSTEAEFVKLLENTFRAVNIALVNEMAIMCDRMDIDIWSVIQAASTKPFGFMPFYPGPGIGGHCIPLDPSYLSWKAKSFGFYSRFIELASDLNTNMPRFVVQKLTRLLNDRNKPLRGADILLLGVSYKPNVNDTRESPAVDIWKLLEDEWGARLSYHDPHVPVLDVVGGARSVELTDARLEQADVVVVVTDHRDIDMTRVAEKASLVFDTRNAIKERYDHVFTL